MNIYGQNELLQTIDNWKEVPRFILINGMKGSGKKTIAKYISKKLNATLIILDSKVESIRKMVNIANEIEDTVLFVIDEGNNLSIGAKNTLLKVTEEAPRNAHIILTCENISTILPTLISRAYCIELFEYELSAHQEYCREHNIEFWENINLVFPNLSYYEKMSIEEAKELYAFSCKVLDNIRLVSGSNAFKIADKIALKDDEEGFNLTQFIYSLIKISGKRMIEGINVDENIDNIRILTKVNRLLYNPVINNRYILDELILDLKGV